jgi:DNA-binding response OmpR family regulator
MPHATILVVDDEEGVRTVIAQTLEGAGFEVLQAEHGEAALQVIGVPVLFITGREPMAAGVRLLRKPFGPALLLETVTMVLAESEQTERTGA